MYRVIQRLNNNVALVKNSSGEQAVVMGLGLVFQKKKGDLIMEDKIEKVFLLKNDEFRENFLMLLKDVPLNFITLTYDVIDELIKTYDYPMQDYVYVTLTDHIYCSYQALRKGNYLDSKLPDISADYTLEYRMAAHVLETIKDKLAIDFPKDELARIALHFINARGVASQPQASQADLTKDIIKLVEQELQANGIERTTSNSNFYDRFMIHLTYFMDVYQADSKENESLTALEEHLKTDYARSYEIGLKVYGAICQRLAIDEKRSERVYIVLHIQRLL